MTTTVARYVTKQHEEIGTELSKISSKTSLTPEAVLKAAKSKSNPLHKCFEWDDGAAAESYRLIQAAWLIRQVKVTILPQSGRPQSVRAFIHIHDSEDDISKFVPVLAAYGKPEWRAQLLGEAKRDMESFRRKYSALNELAPLMDSIDRLTEVMAAVPV